MTKSAKQDTNVGPAETAETESAATAGADADSAAAAKREAAAKPVAAAKPEAAASLRLTRRPRTATNRTSTM